MERLLHFLPSILFYVCAIGAINLFLQMVLVPRLYFLSLVRGALVQNKTMETFLFILKSVSIGPVREELLFRMPLIILFEELSSSAWKGITISSVLFMLSHLFFPFVSEGKNPLPHIHIIKTIISLLAGIILGVVGVRYHSISYCIFLHIIANILGIILPNLSKIREALVELDEIEKKL